MSWAANETTITSKGQLVIPAEIRRRYGIKPGQKFKVLEEEGTIRLIPIITMKLEDARGSLKTRKTTRALLAEAREVEDAHERRLTAIAQKKGRK